MLNFTTQAEPEQGSSSNKINYLKTELDKAYFLIPLGIKEVVQGENGAEILHFTDESPFLKPKAIEFTAEDKARYKQNPAAPFVRYSVHGTNIDNKTKSGGYKPGFAFPCFNKNFNPDLELDYDGDGCPVCSLFYGINMLASEAQKDLIDKLIAESGLPREQVLGNNGRVDKNSSFYKNIYKNAAKAVYKRYDILQSGSYQDDKGERQDSATQTTHIMLFARLKLEGNSRLKSAEDPNSPLPLDWDIVATDLSKSRLAKIGGALYERYGDESREVKANVPLKFYFPKKADKKAAGKDLSISLFPRVVYGPLYTQFKNNDGSSVFETEENYGEFLLKPLIAEINAMKITTSDIKNMFDQIKPKPIADVSNKIKPVLTRVVGETVDVARLKGNEERFKKIDNRVGMFLDWDKAMQLSQTGSVANTTTGAGSVDNQQVQNPRGGGGFGAAASQTNQAPQQPQQPQQTSGGFGGQQQQQQQPQQNPAPQQTQQPQANGFGGQPQQQNSAPQQANGFGGQQQQQTPAPQQANGFGGQQQQQAPAPQQQQNSGGFGGQQPQPQQNPAPQQQANGGFGGGQPQQQPQQQQQQQQQQQTNGFGGQQPQGGGFGQSAENVEENKQPQNNQANGFGGAPTSSGGWGR